MQLRLSETKLFNELANAHFFFIHNKERFFASNQTEDSLICKFIELANLLAKCCYVHGLAPLDYSCGGLKGSLNKF